MVRTILLTFTATTTALGLAASLFLNTLLGTFGLAATTVETLRGLQASHQVIETLKERHQRKQARVAKRFAKRAGRRVATAAVAAATIGTVAVTATMAGMEVNDYCEEKRALQEEAHVLYGTDADFDWGRCYAGGKADATVMLADLKDSAFTQVSGLFGVAGE